MSTWWRIVELVGIGGSTLPLFSAMKKDRTDDYPILHLTLHLSVSFDVFLLVNIQSVS